MDTLHWPQEIMKPMEEIEVQNITNSSCSKPSSNSTSLERKSRTQKEATVNCPRCNSTNTKFCYYNNYSLSQPRYFCKTCRRYWTKGGSLRNVPVGGGSRRNKRSLSSISSHNSFMSKKLPDLVVPNAPTPVRSQNPSMHHEQVHDLNSGFSSTNDLKSISELIQVPNFDVIENITSVSTSSHLSALELLTEISKRGMMNSFMPVPIPDPNSVYSSSGQMNMLPVPEFKIPSLNFSLDGMESSIHESSRGRLLFTFEDLKTSTMTTIHEGNQNVQQNRDSNSVANGFWNGMLGGGSW